ncbi:MAG: endo alpha-1,4 polygalactosaminidase [Candidatus Riflebacteria bacterium]|nr:endo alpha-1,4 polygalactosaminidase [Candidatus Riflebacteria bacterium]
MNRPFHPGLVLVALAAVWLPHLAVAADPPPGTGPASSTGPAGTEWQKVDSFAYWLQGIEPEKVAAFDCDLAIVDTSRDGSAAGAFTTQQVQQMQRGARPKRLLAYMSIGEAEPYRFYWQKGWQPGQPAWLERPNPDWPDNYRVRFWEPAWQAVLLGSPGSYLDRILDAGFDGVYLDIVDGYESYEASRPQARREMVALVKALAAYARRRQPGFGVFPQNALELVKEPGYLECLTGVGKESTWFTWGDSPRPAEETRWEEGLMTQFVAAGKLVLATDYCRRPENLARVKARARQLGVLSYCTTRELDRLFPQTAGR